MCLGVDSMLRFASEVCKLIFMAVTWLILIECMLE